MKEKFVAVSEWWAKLKPIIMPSVLSMMKVVMSHLQLVQRYVAKDWMRWIVFRIVASVFGLALFGIGVAGGGFVMVRLLASAWILVPVVFVLAVNIGLYGVCALLIFGSPISFPYDDKPEPFDTNHQSA